MPAPPLADLYSNCDEVGDCRLWRGRVNSDGAPVINIERCDTRVRRTVYTLVHGQIPAERYVIAKCWNGRCISEACLQAVTRKRQMQLASEQGRLFNPQATAKKMQRGRAAAHVKLDMDKARRMRALRLDGATLPKLAAQFGVHVSLVHRVVTNQAWRENLPGNSVFNFARSA